MTRRQPTVGQPISELVNRLNATPRSTDVTTTLGNYVRKSGDEMSGSLSWIAALAGIVLTIGAGQILDMNGILDAGDAESIVLPDVDDITVRTGDPNDATQTFSEAVIDIVSDQFLPRRNHATWNPDASSLNFLWYSASGSIGGSYRAASDTWGFGIGTPANKVQIYRTDTGTSLGTTTAALGVRNGSNTVNTYSLMAFQGSNTSSDPAVVTLSRIGAQVSDPNTTSVNGDFIVTTVSNSSETEKIRVKDSGNTGIGTSTPASKLDVEGSISIGSTYSGTTAAPTNGALIEGSVGIGTTTPANKLDIEGSIAVGATYSGTSAAPSNGAIIEGSVGIGTASPSTKTEVRQDQNATTILRSTNANADDGGNSTAHAVVQAYNGSTGVGLIAWPVAHVYSTLSGGLVGLNSSAPAGMGFEVLTPSTGPFKWVATGASSSAELMRLTFAGSLGIGTASPAERLDVSGNSVVGRASGASATAYSLVYDQGSSNSVGLQKRGTSASGNIGLGNGASEIVSVGGDFGIYNATASKYIAFGTGGTASSNERMRIDGNGLVGIGTTSPGQLLHVRGATPFIQMNNTAATGYGLYFNHASGDAYIGQSGAADNLITGSVAADVAIRSNGKNILFSTDSGSNAQMYLKNGGNVGIANTSPQAKLHVRTGSSGTLPAIPSTSMALFESVSSGPNGQINLIGSTTSTLAFQAGDTATLAQFSLEYANTGDKATLKTSATERMSWDSTATIINDTGASVDTRIEGDNDPNLVVVTASTDRVGIGIQPSGAKFHVLGTVKIQDGSQATGYVFTSTDANGLGTWSPMPAIKNTQRTFRSDLPNLLTNFTLTADVAYFVYVGQVGGAAITPKYVEFYVGAGGTGTQTAEVGLFSSTNPPNKGNQSLTKLVSTGTVDDLTTAGIKRNTSAFATSVAAGTYLWAGIRTNMLLTQPAPLGLGYDYQEGLILQTTTSGALTGSGPWTGAIITEALVTDAPDLRVTLD